MYLSVGISLTYPGSAAASLTGAEAFLADYSSDGQGYAHYFSGATPSVKIRDTATPANNVDTSLASFDAYNSVLTYTSPSPKNVMQSDGYVKYSAHNFARYSEDATNVVWRFANAGMNSADGDVTTAPDGSATADGFTEDTSTGVHRVYYYDGSTGLVAGLDYRLAFRIKGNGRTKFFIQSPPLGNALTTIDLVAVTSSNSNWSITALPDDWFLVEGTATASASGAFSFYTMYDDGSGTTYTGDGTSGMYWWGLQLHRAPADETYLPTTTAARYALPIEYDTSNDAIGVLVEPAATNLLVQSSSHATSWTNSGGSVTANNATGTSGEIDADTFVETAATTSYAHYQSGSFGTNQPFAFSVELNMVNRRYVALAVHADNAVDACAAIFDLQAGGSTDTGTIGTYSAVTAGTEDLGNGWYKCYLTATTTGAIGQVKVSPVDTATDTLVAWGDYASPVGVNGDSYEIGNAQLELGSVVTSPIVTAGSTVTRLVDNITIATTAFPYSSSASTMFVFGKYDRPVSTLIPFGSSSSSVEIRSQSSDTTALGVAGGDLFVVATAGSGAWDTGSGGKVAQAFDASNLSVCFNNGTVGTDTGTSASITYLSVGSRSAGVLPFGGHIKSIAYIPERITDANLGVMTT